MTDILFYNISARWLNLELIILY